MKTLLVTTPEAKFEARTVRNLVPESIEGWHIQTLSSAALSQAVTAPDVTLVQIDEATTPADFKAIMPRLARLQSTAPQGSFVLFALRHRAQAAQRQVQPRQHRLQALVQRIQEELRQFPNPERVDIAFVQNGPELSAKLTIIEAKLALAPAPPRPSPLDQVKEALQATADLRAASGKLSAEAVAEAFGLSLNQLATSLGRSRQALSKTPDADAIQDQLTFYERVARLRAALPEGQFLKWLRMPNSELDEQTPLSVLASGEGQVVADLVDDMLTGATS